METFIVYVNDAEHARKQVLAFIEGRGQDRWVLVGCPPRLPRHSGRFLSQPALKRWRTDWTREAVKEIVDLLTSRGHEVITRVVHVPLIAFTRQLRGEFGAGAHLLDARRPRGTSALEPITSEEPVAPPGWAATSGVLALGALITVAAE
jgi:hypothetical protein